MIPEVIMNFCVLVYNNYVQCVLNSSSVFSIALQTVYITIFCVGVNLALKMCAMYLCSCELVCSVSSLVPC